jgi:hypothetical protein
VGGGALATSTHPLNTSSDNTATRRPPHPSYTQQHTTALHNSTQVHKTTNVPVVFMALIINGFEGCNIITRGLWKGWTPKIETFLGPKKLRYINSYSMLGV